MVCDNILVTSCTGLVGMLISLPGTYSLASCHSVSDLLPDVLQGVTQKCVSINVLNISFINNLLHFWAVIIFGTLMELVVIFSLPFHLLYYVISRYITYH